MKRFVFLCSLAMPCLASDDAGRPVNFQRAFFSEKSSKSRLTPVNACILRHINFKLASLPVEVSRTFALSLASRYASAQPSTLEHIPNVSDWRGSLFNLVGDLSVHGLIFMNGALDRDPYCLYKLGRLLGNILPLDRSDIPMFYLLHADEHPYYSSKLSLCYLFGHGVLQNVSLAAKYCWKALLGGDPVAKYVFYVFYKFMYQHRGYCRNVSEFNRASIFVHKCLQQSANQGYAPAQDSCGSWLCHEKQFQQAIELFRLGAEQGDVYAQYNYGHHLCKGICVEKDLVQAARYFQLSADQGLAGAQYSYGTCLHTGEGVAQNLQLAAYYLKLSADQGDARGQYDYGILLRNGNGVTQDLKQAARYFKMCADQGFAPGQFDYGLCLKNGAGVAVDTAQAIRYFKLSADQGEADAQNSYGACLKIGDGVPQNLVLAAHYFKLSAFQGNALGQFNYGVCLKRGEGVPQNLVQAAHYFKLSADQGDANGQYGHGICLKGGHGVAKNLVNAAHYFKLSADQNNAYGQFNYGTCLQNGEGVRVDLKQAARYFKLSADQGHADALVALIKLLSRGVR